MKELCVAYSIARKNSWTWDNRSMVFQIVENDRRGSGIQSGIPMRIHLDPLSWSSNTKTCSRKAKWGQLYTFNLPSTFMGQGSYNPSMTIKIRQAHVPMGIDELSWDTGIMVNRNVPTPSNCTMSSKLCGSPRKLAMLITLWTPCYSLEG